MRALAWVLHMQGAAGLSGVCCFVSGCQHAATACKPGWCGELAGRAPHPSGDSRLLSGGVDWGSVGASSLCGFWGAGRN